MIWKFLEFLGIIQCAHSWSSWSLKKVNVYYEKYDKVIENVNTGKQHRTCSKCGKIQEEWV